MDENSNWTYASLVRYCEALNRIQIITEYVTRLFIEAQLIEKVRSHQICMNESEMTKCSYDTHTTSWEKKHTGAKINFLSTNYQELDV